MPWEIARSERPGGFVQGSSGAVDSFRDQTFLDGAHHGVRGDSVIGRVFDVGSAVRVVRVRRHLASILRVFATFRGASLPNPSFHSVCLHINLN